MPVCTTRIVSAALAILLCCTPELLFSATAQSAAPQNSQPAATQPEGAPQNSPATLPDAPQRQQQPEDPAQATAPAAQNSTATQQSPEGTAAARSAKTIGGPASKPAGSAIAPAKQHQVRSLLIKIGAIAGAGAALGTVYALTRGTPSKPPGAH